MNTSIKLIIVLFASLSIQGCSVMHTDIAYSRFEVVNKLNDDTHGISDPCDIKYSLIVTGNSKGNNSEVFLEENTIQKLRNKYVAFTRMVLEKKGCSTTYVVNQDNAELQINVDRNFRYGGEALISGLTLGLIPLWDTINEQFTFTFKYPKEKTEHSYIVNEKRFIHLFTMLFALVRPLFPEYELQEFYPYEESLTDFLERCREECVSN